MAVINPTSVAFNTGARTMIENTMTASDTLTWLPGIGQELMLRNATAGALTVLLVGNAAGTVSLPGVPFFNAAGGYSTGSIGVGIVRIIPLDTIGAYLEGGTVTLTGGTGMIATLLNPQ